MSPITALIAGVPVSHLEASIDWYTRFFGRAPDLRVGDEVLWDVDESATLFIEPNAAQAGAGRITFAVTGLDDLLEHLAAQGIEHEPVETYSNGVRHVTIPDPDGNALAFAGVPATGTEALQAFLDAFNARDVDAIMSFFAEDCVLEMPRGPAPGGRRLVGKQQVREGIQSRIDGIPDLHYGDDRHWLCGDRGVSEWTLRGTQRTGEPIEVRGCDLLELADGKITRKDSFWKIVE